jgi:predicted ATPase
LAQAGAAAGWRTDFGRQVRDALLRLYDPVYLRRHPLIRHLPGAADLSRSAAGEALRQQLLEALEQVRPEAQRGAFVYAERAYQLLRLRYVEGLDAPSVQARLGLAKSQYYRDHNEALEAVITALAERWQPDSGEEAAVGAAAAAGSPARHNLPPELTSFVGRRGQIEELAGRLETARMLTLTGAGGSGKTRLARRVARRLVRRFADGVWFVELAPISDPLLAAPAVASVLGIREEPQESLQAALVRALAGRELLLLLDNCEHLIRPCAELASALLAGCPRVHVLATSRAPLNVAGEQRWLVPALSSPEPGAACDLAQLAQCEAVELFLDRAGAVAPGFQLTEANAAPVADICRRLDGLPLAIELAAARLRMLSPAEIAGRLDHRFSLLTGGPSDLLPRQQTLKALVDWSYDLLSEPERLLLGRLAVFAGSWTLAAAEEVCAGDPLQVEEVLDLLAQLVDRSLVVCDAGPNGTRYRLLETVQEYAAEKLAQQEDAAALGARHARCYLAQAQRLGDVLRCSSWRTEWWAALKSDHGNLNVALGWSRDHGAAYGDDGLLGLRLAAALHFYWFVQGRWHEARYWLESLLASAPAQAATRERAAGLCSQALFGMMQDELAAAEAQLVEAQQLAHDLADPPAAAMCDMLLGFLKLLGGYHAAEVARLERSAMDQARQLGLDWLVRQAGMLLGLAELYQGDVAGAEAQLGETVAACRDSGDRAQLGQALNYLGIVQVYAKDWDRARETMEEGEARCQAMDNRGNLIIALINLSHLALRQGDLPRAQLKYEAALRLASDLGQRRFVVYALAGIAAISAATGRYERAARLFAASEVLRLRIGLRMPPWELESHEHGLEVVRQALGPSFAAGWASGQAMPIDRAVAYALEPPLA